MNTGRRLDLESPLDAPVDIACLVQPWAGGAAGSPGDWEHAITPVGCLWQLWLGRSQARTDERWIPIVILSRSNRRSQTALDLLSSWLSEDEAEHTQTWEFLRRALDEDRLSDRKLF